MRRANLHAELEEYGSEEDKGKVAGKETTCSTERAQQLCVRVGAALADGPPLKNGDLTELGSSASSSGDPGRGLVKRILDGKVTAADLAFDGNATCGSQVVDGLARKLARTPEVWSEPPFAVSETMLAAFKQMELTPESKAILRAAGESVAKPALTKPLVTGLEPARELCTLVATLHAEAGPNCTAYDKKCAIATAAADAVAKREGAQQAAREKAADAQCEARRAARERCNDGCDRFKPEDPTDPDTRWDRCMEGCVQRVPLGGDCLL